MSSRFPYTPRPLQLKGPALRPSSPAIPALPPHATLAQSTPKTEALGQRLGNFTLTRLLGQGGMGAVYLGEHVEINKQVAVKFLKPELHQDPSLVARFFREA